MSCVECKHFRILYEPIKHFDCGRAVCDTHNLVKDFMSHRELKRLECAGFLLYAPKRKFRIEMDIEFYDERRFEDVEREVLLALREIGVMGHKGGVI